MVTPGPEPHPPDLSLCSPLLGPFPPLLFEPLPRVTLSVQPSLALQRSQCLSPLGFPDYAPHYTLEVTLILPLEGMAARDKTV